MSVFRDLAKQCAFFLLGQPPASSLRMAAIRAARPLSVLNLHRVGPPDGSAYGPMDPVLFERLLLWLKRHFEFTTFGGISDQSERPQLILSFDDGYRDFACVTMPILARHGVRANLNVIPDCVDTGLPPLNILAADFIGKAPRQLIRRLQLPGFDFTDRRDLWDRIDRLIKYRSEEEQRRIGEILIPQFFAWEHFQPTPMMSLADVVQAAREGHEIGAHSMSHATMDVESDQFLRSDVSNCRAWFAKRLDMQLRIYAFPNGRIRPGQPQIVQEMGVEHVLLLEDDFGTGRSPHPRFSVSAEGFSEARFKALGSFRRPGRPAR